MAAIVLNSTVNIVGYLNRKELSGFNANAVLVGAVKLVAWAALITVAFFFGYKIDEIIRNRVALPRTELRRGTDGFYTLSCSEVPGLGNGTIRAREIKIRIGNLFIDTSQRIVPPGWILRP